ncbi:MAG: hypothetical protein HY649_06555 [Acidobacteria bacterium]|nr:hypothetical protein [Acidobacteriota bacterium]
MAQLGNPNPESRVPNPESRVWIGRLAAGLLCLSTASTSAAAFCATCYSATAGAGGNIIRSLQIGILILLLPTLAIMAGLAVLAYRRRNPDADVDAPRPEETALAAGTVAVLLPYNKDSTSYHA